MAVQDEGYVKFRAIWERAAALPAPNIAELTHWRDEMYRRQLIGAYENGIGFGNISQRFEGNQFIISGTATGHLPHLGPAHFTVVTDFDVQQNTVYCRGAILASSESMSHAIIYQACPTVHAVIHVHHAAAWERLLDQVPTTVQGATYGSPEMANSILNLLKNNDLSQKKIFVMRSHPEGIFVFGETLERAVAVLLEWLGEALSDARK